MLERQFECVWKGMKTVRDLITCIPAQVRSQRALRSSTSWGKMKISALPSCVNSSTSLISSSWGCRKSKRMCRAKTRSHSETSDIKHSLSPGVCFLICHCFCRFVSISKNYRSVIRACMEELQQNAGRRSCDTLHTWGMMRLVSWSCSFSLLSFNTRRVFSVSVWRSGTCWSSHEI